MSLNQHVASRVTSVHHVLLLSALVGAGVTGSMAPTQAAVSDTLAQRVTPGPVQAVAPVTSPAVAAPAASPAVAAAAAAAANPAQGLAAPRVGFSAEPEAVRRTEAALQAARRAAPPAESMAARYKFTPDDRYFAQLRSKLRWVDIRYGGAVLQTPDVGSRLLLAQSAAQKAGLAEVGLSYRDVYGIINAETSWIPRTGASKDGTPNLGIAQFEPATAKAIGLRNPADPVEAVHAAAVHMKDAALWSARRIAGLDLKPHEHATLLREGVSIYYNLSVRGRNTWNGRNTAALPVETRRHIENARLGAQEAAELSSQLAQVRSRMNGKPVLTAGDNTTGG